MVKVSTKYYTDRGLDLNYTRKINGNAYLKIIDGMKYT